MAILINFAGASILRPGSYSHTIIAESGVASPALGVVALIGEANEGSAFSAESGLSAVTYGPDEFSAIRDKYGSGELLDAARLAISPSNDPQILGGAQQLILLKTNNSSSASLSIPTGILKAKRPGQPGNNTSYQCSIVASQAIITVSRLDLGISEVSEPLGNNVVMTIQCTDGAVTSAVATLNSSHFVTVIGGGTAQNINVPVSNFHSISQLAAYINAQPGYSASIAAGATAYANKPVATLDQFTGQGIQAAFNIKRDVQDVIDFFASSSLVTYTDTALAGLPSVAPKTFLSGGTLGSTSPAAIQNCLDALLKMRINFIVPLFSQDASADISAGITDPNSNYTIDSVHAALNSHVQQASTVKGRKERQGFAAYKGSFANSVNKASILNSARVSMAMQDVDVITANGDVELKQPHMLQVLNAGMKASAAIGLPNTFKSPQISGMSHLDFDPETEGDKAIAANIVFVEKAPAGGFRFVLDNSTYAQDLDSWIYNRPSVLYAADFAALAIRQNTEVFVGQRNSDVSEQTIANLLISVMDALRSAGVIVADTNTKGRGYKDLSVKINGSTVNIDVTLALVEGLEFILSNIKVQRAS